MIDETRLRAESAQLEHLLEELCEMVTPPAWQRVEQILRRVVALYGAGLAHLLDHARAAGAETPALDHLTAEDELLASLLVLHGLHPLSSEHRIQRALEAARAQLDLGEEELVFVGVADGGIVHLQVRGGLGGGAMSSRLAEGIIRRAIEAAAPEVTGVEIGGVAVPRDPSLVQLRPRREAP